MLSILYTFQSSLPLEKKITMNKVCDSSNFPLLKISLMPCPKSGQEFNAPD